MDNRDEKEPTPEIDNRINQVKTQMRKRMARQQLHTAESSIVVVEWPKAIK